MRRSRAGSGGLAGIGTVLVAFGSLLVPGPGEAQIIRPPQPVPELETEVQLEDEVLGIVVGGALGGIRMAGVAGDYLHDGVHGQLFLSLELQAVAEARAGVAHASPWDPLTQSRSTVQSAYVELLWTMVDRRVKLRGGPRFAWYRMERTWWDDGRRSTLGGGGLLVAIMPVRESVEVEVGLSVSSFTTIDPNEPVERADKPALESLLRAALRYRIR